MQNGGAGILISKIVSVKTELKYWYDDDLNLVIHEKRLKHYSNSISHSLKQVWGGKRKGIASSFGTAARPNKRSNLRLQDESVEEEEQQQRVTWRQNRRGTIDIIEGTQHSRLSRYPLAQQPERFNQRLNSLGKRPEGFLIERDFTYADYRVFDIPQKFERLG
ncbi:hypothetical protein E3N88_01395 [Mikania micrantha]|uniref:Uncharacterized protein n=1 Tax=Mikania micrantha TaxID=192012 RepID=A0A5N6Q0Y9_9ASTR|nr:hypothetical protein E3N88_01395 [Mikania micrantha]